MASVSAGIRTVLVDAPLSNVGSRIYRDIAPPETTYPFVTISDEITNQAILVGDQTVIARNRQMRVNLWQVRTAEDVTLVDEIAQALDAVNILADKAVLRVRVFDIQRIFNSDDDTILHAVTLNVIQKAQ